MRLLGGNSELLDWLCKKIQIPPAMNGDGISSDESSEQKPVSEKDIMEVCIVLTLCGWKSGDVKGICLLTCNVCQRKCGMWTTNCLKDTD